MKTIYEPEGRAREYSPLALNLYTGCAHRCTYCYARKMAKMYGTPECDFNTPAPRKGLLAELDKKAAGMQKAAKGRERREINLCFMCDPYSTPLNGDITREALLILEKHKMNVSILTKAGTKACRDFDILARNGWKFGSTLTCFGEMRKEKEPGAAKLSDRLGAIIDAKKQGIFTYVSLEPVIDTNMAIEILRWRSPGFVDFWKIGKINYDKQVEAGIDWKQFVADARRVLGDVPHMFKKDLLRAAGEA
jgi:DNA repair photolyase